MKRVRFDGLYFIPELRFRKKQKK